MKRKSLFTALAALVLVGTIALPACQRDNLQWCTSKLGMVKYSRKVNGGGAKSGFTWSITIEYADRAVVFAYKGDRLESNSSAYILYNGSAEILDEIITKYAS